MFRYTQIIPRTAFVQAVYASRKFPQEGQRKRKRSRLKIKIKSTSEKHFGIRNALAEILIPIPIYYAAA